MMQADSTNALVPNHDDATKFLDWLRPSDQRSVTLIPVERTAGMRLPTHAHNPGGKTAFLDWAAENAHNVYICVARVSQFSKKATKADVVASQHASVDIDVEKVDSDEQFAEDLRSVVNLLSTDRPEGVPEPSCIVFSGGGAQAYWALTHEVPGDAIESINRGLILKLRAKVAADEVNCKVDSTFNCDRVMRLPGSINQPDAKKQAKGRKPQLSQVLSLKPELVYDPATLPSAEVIDPKSKKTKEKMKDLGLGTGEAPRTNDLETLDVPDWVKRAIKDGKDPLHTLTAGQDDTRSGWGFRVVCELIRQGVSDARIVGIMTDPRYRIADYINEKSNPVEAAEKEVENGHKKAKRAEKQKSILEGTDARMHDGAGTPGIPSARLAERLILNDGSADTLACYCKPNLGEGELVSSYERLFLSDESQLWQERGKTHVYQALRPFSGSLFLRPTCQDGQTFLAPTGLVKLDDGFVKNVEKSLNMQHSRPGFFDTAPVGVAFSNGFVGKDANLVPLTKEHRQRKALPFEYMPNVELTRDAPLFAQCIEDWFAPKNLGSDASKEEAEAAVQDALDKMACLSEFAGLAIIGGFGPSRLGRANIHQAIMNIGEGHNGKSVFLDLIDQMVPDEYKAHVPPQDMGEEYQRDTLAGKRVNIVPEIPEKEVISTGHLKAIISCDPGMTARRPYYPPYDFQPLAGHIFSANSLPRFSDSSGGFLRRWVVIEWNNVIPEHKRNTQLSADLIRKEGAAIASWFVQRAAQAFARGSLTIPASSNTRKASWLEESDQVVEFVAEKLSLRATPGAQNTWTPVGDVYDQYVIWAKNAGHKFTLARKAFTARLGRAVNNTMKKQGGTNRIPYDIVSPQSGYETENRSYSWNRTF